MNKHSSIKSSGSLLERASEMYDFGAALRGGATGPAPIVQSAHTGTPAAEPVMQAPVSVQPNNPASSPVAAPVTPVPDVQPAIVAAAPAAPRTAAAPRTEVGKPVSVKRHNGVAKIDRQMLTENNFINPEGPVTAQVEEFRIVKRQLLLAARGGKGYQPVEHGERILVCSAHPNEGKTFCAVNLALSMAREKDNRVLLVDADFAKPSVLKTLGIEQAPGLMDALADPNCDAESLVIETDVNGLSVLPAGEQTNQDTEYLAASRTEAVINELSRNDPSRIIIFDSPPALAASPASVLASLVGQCLVVVRADETTDSALRDALNLLSGCDNIQLLLNRAKFSPTGRKFGSYYGYGA